MLFTDEELFGLPAVQLDIFDVLTDVLAPAGVDYGDEPGVIDLFGAGQCSLAGV